MSNLNSLFPSDQIHDNLPDHGEHRSVPQPQVPFPTLQNGGQGVRIGSDRGRHQEGADGDHYPN